MALVQHKFLKVSSIIARIGVCRYSSVTDKTHSSHIKKSVFISQSPDIFTNLALEDWLYRNFDFTNHNVLMLWRNNPCVVIGRHQNPWLEANVGNLHKITEKGIVLARRNSGGGTVYHDQGNLNLTFFTSRDLYNRKYNLELIARALFREYGMKVDISKREDLTVRNIKVSGTAAKLGRPNAYHHCTLLVEANRLNLHEALQKQENNITTNATRSVKSKIMNLCEDNPKVTVDNLITAMGWEYLRTKANSLTDGGMEWANQQNGFQMINPTESWFPGITELRNTLTDWEWCYGKTPKFSVSRSFPIPSYLLNEYNADGVSKNLQVTIVVEKGRVEEVTLFVPPGISSLGFSGEANVVTSFKGHKFTEDALNKLQWSFADDESAAVGDKNKFVTECVKQVMTSV